MKSIEPVSIWVDGSVKEANKLNLYLVHDDLKSTCTFYYGLLIEEEVSEGAADPSGGPSHMTNRQTILAQGNLVMNGDDYQNWNSEEDINQAAYEWVAGKLSLNLE